MKAKNFNCTFIIKTKISNEIILFKNYYFFYET